MKRSFALGLAALAALGCRSSPPANDPYLRVPPPGTGQAMPMQPMMPGQSAPGMTPQPLFPGTPPAATPPPGLQPTPQNKYMPPGGSFNYQQSLLDQHRGTDPRLSGGSADLGLERATSASATTESFSPASGPVRSPAAAPTVIRSTSESPTATPTGTTAADNRVNPVAFNQAVAEPAHVARASAAVAENAATPDAGQPIVRMLDPRPSASSAIPATETAPSVVVGQPLRVGDSEPAVDITSLPKAKASDAADASIAIRSVQNGPASDRTLLSDDAPNPPENSQSSTAPERRVDAAAKQGNDTASAGGAQFAYPFDYVWLRGQLEYSQATKQWKLRYIPVYGQTDRFGGSVVLTNAALVEGYQPGEFVVAHGQLSSEPPPPGSFAPIYDLKSIDRQGR